MSNKWKERKALGIWACCHDWEMFSHLFPKLSPAHHTAVWVQPSWTWVGLNHITNTTTFEAFDNHELMIIKLYITCIEATSSTLKLSQNKFDIISGVILLNRPTWSVSTRDTTTSVNLVAKIFACQFIKGITIIIFFIFKPETCKCLCHWGRELLLN